MKNWMIIILAFGITGCFGARTAVDDAAEIEEAVEVAAEESVMTLLDYGQTAFPDYTDEQLVAGKALYETKCALCHAPKKPGNYSRERIDQVVPKMVNMANEKKEAGISDEQQDLIHRYMVSVMLMENQ